MKMSIYNSVNVFIEGIGTSNKNRENPKNFGWLTHENTVHRSEICEKYNKI